MPSVSNVYPRCAHLAIFAVSTDPSTSVPTTGPVVADPSTSASTPTSVAVTKLTPTRQEAIQAQTSIPNQANSEESEGGKVLSPL